MALRALGFKAADLRVIVVKDLNMKVGHAVLGVYMGGKIYLLDNLLKGVVESSRIRHYAVYYSVNEESWWFHLR